MQGRDLTIDQKTKFIKKLQSTNGNVSKAAQAAGVSRAAIYLHKEKDADFSALWDDAIDSVLDGAEQEVHRRAVKGVLEPVLYRGQKVGSIRKFSDRLLEFMLKAGRPDKFRERMDINQNVSGTLDVNIEHEIDLIWGDGEDIDALTGAKPDDTDGSH